MQIKGGNIYIKSRDTDSIYILLLHIRGWIDIKTEKIKYGIFLESSGRDNCPGEKPRDMKPRFIDVVALWRSILVYFRDNYPGIPCPIETMILLILLTGSDYTDGFPQFGPAKIWESFKE